MIPKDRIHALARRARPETPLEQELVEIAETFDYLRWHSNHVIHKAALLDKSAKLVARLIAKGCYYPEFHFVVEMAAWAPEPARKGFFSLFRKAA